MPNSIPLFWLYIFLFVISQVLLLLLFTYVSFFFPLMTFNWSLSNSKPPHVSRTLLSILADFDNALVWMVSTHVLVSNFSSTFTNPLMTVPSEPIIIIIIIIIIIYSLRFFTSVLADGLPLQFE